MAAVGSGSRWSEVKLRLPAPQSGRRSYSSGRDKVRMKMGRLRLHSSICSTKSMRPGSAKWKSSNTITTGALAASRSKNVRQAPNSCSEPTSTSRPRSESKAGPIQARSVASGTCASSMVVTAARVVASSASSWRRARLRTISPRAQKLMPSP